MATGPFGSAISSKYFQNTGVPVIRGGNLSTDVSCRLSDDNLIYVSEEKASEFRRSIVRDGDLIFTCWGTINQIGLITKSQKHSEYIISNKQMKFTPDQSKADSLFLYYLFSSPIKQAEILQNSIGAAVPGFNLGQLKQHKLNLPPLREQVAIRELLGSLDDKIALNHQINTTLESMAQALFKSWFVDFDPVIDNALAAGNPIPEALQARADTRAALGDQRKPLPDHIRQQFPDRFMLTEEMGWVPEGWHISTIGEQVETTGGGTPSTKNPDFWENGTHPFCTPKDMSQLKSLVLMDTERLLTDDGVRKISSGQLPKGTVLMSSRAPIGYLTISDIPVSVNQGIIAMLPNQNYGPVYLLCWATTNMKQITDRANGSTFQEISKKNFRPIPFLVPGKGILEAFNEQAEAIYSRILLTSEQTDALTKLRDTLLPKLLSGELRIPEAEKHIEEGHLALRHAHALQNRHGRPRSKCNL
nr:restriction endonuclease subunit S [Marinobacter subterrani]